jgi:hypothetical protein
MSNYRLYDSRETLLNGGDGLSAAAVGDFWRWAFGNLNEDTLKGIFAEWLVGRMLGLDMRLGARNGGANSDLILDDGTRIEVKSAAYWQFYSLLRGQVEQLPQTIPEHRLSLLCPPMAAADFAGRTWALIDQARTVRAQGEGLQPLGYP